MTEANHANLTGPLTIGRVPTDEEPDTILIGADHRFFARVVGQPGMPAEPVARLLADATESYRKHFGARAGEAAQADALGILIDAVANLSKMTESEVVEMLLAKDGTLCKPAANS